MSPITITAIKQLLIHYTIFTMMVINVMTMTCHHHHHHDHHHGTTPTTVSKFPPNQQSHKLLNDRGSFEKVKSALKN